MSKIVVLGISGAGKSTLADQLCGELNQPLIDLDALHHLANWTPNPACVDDVTEALAAFPGGWVVAGNYLAKLGGTVLGQADIAIWLDPPRSVPPWRAARRTVRRFVTREVLWNGNRERFRNIVASDHPIWWSWSQADAVRAQIKTALDSYPDLCVFRIRQDSDVESTIERLRLRLT